MKIYIETSVIGFLFAHDAPEKMRITKQFFKSLKDKEAFISELSLEEIEQSPEEKRKLLINTIRKYELKVLKSSKDAEKLADQYVQSGIVPERYYNDALHIALAVVNKVDVLVSWNMQHIVRLKTIVGVREINKKLEYEEILILNPEEVL